MIVEKSLSEDEVVAIALQQEKVRKFIDGKEIAKIIYVPGKILNIVVR